MKTLISFLFFATSAQAQVKPFTPDCSSLESIDALSPKLYMNALHINSIYVLPELYGEENARITITVGIHVYTLDFDTAQHAVEKAYAIYQLHLAKKLLQQQCQGESP